MSAPKGTIPPNAGKGRVKGVPNKSTKLAREAVAAFVDGNAGRLQGWLDEICKSDGPQAAFNCVLALLEYHVPKLQRTELTGSTDGNGTPVIEVRFVGSPKGN